VLVDVRERLAGHLARGLERARVDAPVRVRRRPDREERQVGLREDRVVRGRTQVLAGRPREALAEAGFVDR
jgi:hypothetical protein